jgi:putative endonuclease
VGVTSNLPRRVWEHSRGINDSFTKKYNVKFLMYCEVFEDIHEAINREKSLKGKTRNKKNALVCAVNPLWKDLSIDII